jgi:hypothetical protein
MVCEEYDDALLHISLNSEKGLIMSKSLAMSYEGAVDDDDDRLQNLRQSIGKAVMARLKSEIPELSPHFGEDYKKSDDTELLNDNRQMRFLAFAFRPWRMWDLHIGVVPIGGRRLSLGFHISERAAPAMMSNLEQLGAGIGAKVEHKPAIVEYQANFPTVAVDDVSFDSLVDTICELCRKYAPVAAAIACPAEMRDDIP